MDSQKFGTFIAQCRKDKKMTQADLAAQLNVTDKAISRWERGVGDVYKRKKFQPAQRHQISEQLSPSRQGQSKRFGGKTGLCTCLLYTSG